MRYYKGFHDSVKAKVGDLEKNVRERRGTTSSIEIDAKLMPWILDTSFSRSQVTKYFKQIDIYWQTKTIVSQLVEDLSSKHINSLVVRLIKPMLDRMDVITNMKVWLRSYEL
jgi:hypothetical protein